MAEVTRHKLQILQKNRWVALGGFVDDIQKWANAHVEELEVYVSSDGFVTLDNTSIHAPLPEGLVYRLRQDFDIDAYMDNAAKSRACFYPDDLDDPDTVRVYPLQVGAPLVEVHLDLYGEVYPLQQIMVYPSETNEVDDCYISVRLTPEGHIAEVLIPDDANVVRFGDPEPSEWLLRRDGC